jgi:N-acetylglutamate synthase-like GNAT family acetyltransferase
MPVILEQISDPSPQDYQDLVKIYHDYPNLNTDEHEQWISNQLNNGQLLFAGRFNGRIVGCIWATQAQDNWLLTHLSVRDITRRRGVARQLLTLLTLKAKTQQINLSAENTPACETIRPLLLALEFTLTASTQSTIWQKNHQP